MQPAAAAAPGSAQPVALLMSALAAQRLGPVLQQACGPAGCRLLLAEEQPAGSACGAQLAFVSRDITGRSTKHRLEPATAHFHALLRQAPGLRWVHAHSAGADRPVYQALLARGVRITTSSGANAQVVAQTALAGVLALARGLPALAAAQRERRWSPPPLQALPADLSGQQAVVLGWGPIGQALARYLTMLELRVTVVRRHAGEPAAGLPTAGLDDLPALLPHTDWLLLACPLTEHTRGLVSAPMLRRLRPGARLVNVARGEVLDEPALVAALREGRLAGAYLDVFAQEPLPVDSPLWHLPQVLLTPHCAGFSSGNEARVDGLFLHNLKAWHQGAPLRNEVTGPPIPTPAGDIP